MKKLYKDFDKLLKKHKTNIHSVAVECNIPPTVLYDWKRGRCKPKVDKLVKIADYFDVPLEELI